MRELLDRTYLDLFHRTGSFFIVCFEGGDGGGNVADSGGSRASGVGSLWKS
jgi:hypothetical protein